MHRPGSARRALTCAPPPKYDLDRPEAAFSWPAVWVWSLAVVTLGAGIALIDRIGRWLSP